MREVFQGTGIIRRNEDNLMEVCRNGEKELTRVLI